MKRIDLQHEVHHKVGHYDEVFIVTANCAPSDEENIYDIKVVVKCKKRNRRRIHNGQIEITDPLTCIETVKEYMACGDIVKDMLNHLALKLLQDFPEFYPEVDLDDYERI